MDEKACSRCLIVWPFSNYHKAPGGRYGLHSVCKPCRKAEAREWLVKNRDTINAKRKAYIMSSTGRANRLKSNANYLAKNPEKVAAHKAVHLEILMGRMSRKPCEKCGNEKAEAHHDDYSKPIDVRWLCRKHHAQFHKENPLVL